MAKKKIEGLISNLHQRFADSETSPEQEALLAQMQSQLSEWQGPKPDNNLAETTEMLLNDLEEKHPKAAAVARDILDTLAQIGI